MYSPSRINLLSDQEIEAIYGMPEFNKVERSLYFSVTTDEEILLVKKYGTVKSKIHFIRLLGYFKAKQQFYKFDLGEDSHTQYILDKHFEECQSKPSGQIDSKTYQKQKSDVLLLLGFQDWLPDHELQVLPHLDELIKLYPKGHDALRQLLSYFSNQKMVLPSYRTLQDMFTNAHSRESTRLNELISALPESIEKQLSTLINKENGISPLNIIRLDQKNFKYTAIKMEIDKAQGISDLYDFAKGFLPSLNISKNAIRYYADLAEQYAASRLRRLSQSQQWLQALCF